MTTAEAPSVRTEVQVMFFDTDCGGVVHNIAYLRFIEIARTLLAEQLGLRLKEMGATQKYPSRRSHRDRLIAAPPSLVTISRSRVGSISSIACGFGALFGLCRRTFSSPNAGRCWH